ncbi:MAG: type II toxin-antitoxin system RelE/ParE family toxin [Cyclobacteriaceae bacterium]
MVKKKVVWSEKAMESLKHHHDYIKLDSPQAAKRVKSEIISASKKLPFYPEKYQLDEYYPDNPENIRRVFRWSYRIVYQVNEKSIDILNVIHTSQEPELR